METPGILHADLDAFYAAGAERQAKAEATAEPKAKDEPKAAAKK